MPGTVIRGETGGEYERFLGALIQLMKNVFALSSLQSGRVEGLCPYTLLVLDAKDCSKTGGKMFRLFCHRPLGFVNPQ